MFSFRLPAAVAFLVIAIGVAAGDSSTEVRFVKVGDVSVPADLSPTKALKVARKGEAPTLLVTAAGKDKDAPIVEVAFFVGKPPEDGRVPRAHVKAKLDKDRTTWSAELPVPQEGRELVVSAAFVNESRRVTFRTIRLAFDEPAASPAVETSERASITGVLREGERLQPDEEVVLHDDKGKRIDKTRTDAKGVFVFKNVPAGNYTVSARRGLVMGETPVLIGKEGEQKTGVDIRMSLKP